jgi:hypothetical protein
MKALKITNADMIREILLAVKAGTRYGYSDGDLFLCLAFRTRKELIAICRQCNIRLN